MNPPDTQSLYARIKIALGSFTVFREPTFRLYIFGQFVSLAGGMLQSVVESWIVLQLSASSFQVGLVWSSNFLPIALLAPFTGPIIDKLDKRRVLQVTSVLSIIQSCILGYLTLTHQITVWEVDVLALGLGTINSFDSTARNSILPQTVEDPAHIRPASATFISLYNLGQVIGPGIAGILAVIVGYAGAFFLNAVTFIPLIIVLACMKLRTIPKNIVEGHLITRVLHAARYTFAHKEILMCLFLSTIVSMFGWTYMAILGPASTTMFGAKNIDLYGYMAAAAGCGALAGSFLVLVFSKKLPFKKFVTGGCLTMGIMLILLSLTRDVHVAIFLLFFIGGGFIVTHTSLRSTTLHLTEDSMMSSVMGFALSVAFGATVIGFFSGGYLAGIFGCPFVFATCGVALTLTGIATPFFLRKLQF